MCQRASIAPQLSTVQLQVCPTISPTDLESHLAEGLYADICHNAGCTLLSHCMDRELQHEERPACGDRYRRLLVLFNCYFVKLQAAPSASMSVLFVMLSILFHVLCKDWLSNRITSAGAACRSPPRSIANKRMRDLQQSSPCSSLQTLVSAALEPAFGRRWMQAPSCTSWAALVAPWKPAS